MWELLVGPISTLLDTVLKRVLPPEKMSDLDRTKLQNELMIELGKQDWQEVSAQLEINKTEASSSNMFVSGWRPFIGWVCGVAFAYNFIAQPFFMFVTGKFGYDLSLMPTLDMASLLTVLLGMLGIGGMRTFEKYKGVNGNHE
jgi:Holin of 3TMs, for gene-transfer release